MLWIVLTLIQAHRPFALLKCQTSTCATTSAMNNSNVLHNNEASTAIFISGANNPGIIHCRFFVVCGFITKIISFVVLPASLKPERIQRNYWWNVWWLCGQRDLLFKIRTRWSRTRRVPREISIIHSHSLEWLIPSEIAEGLSTHPTSRNGNTSFIVPIRVEHHHHCIWSPSKPNKSILFCNSCSVMHSDRGTGNAIYETPKFILENPLKKC